MTRMCVCARVVQNPKETIMTELRISLIRSSYIKRTLICPCTNSHSAVHYVWAMVKLIFYRMLQSNSIPKIRATPILFELFDLIKNMHHCTICRSYRTPRHTISENRPVEGGDDNSLNPDDDTECKKATNRVVHFSPFPRPVRVQADIGAAERACH